MGSSKVLPLRALPRFFIPGADFAEGPVELSGDDWKKVHNVLRLSSGDQIAVLPNDGSIWRCTLQGHKAVPDEQAWPNTESDVSLTLCLAYLKADKLEDVIRRGTEIGVKTFVLFQGDRTVVKWDSGKISDKLKRWNSIAQEACELSYRTNLPQIIPLGSLSEVLTQYPASQILSESDQESRLVQVAQEMVLVVGPEGGWSPREAEQIRDRGVTLGTRVLSADAAALSACAISLIKTKA